MSAEEAVKSIVDKMWTIHDTNEKGKLTKDETKLFLRDCIEIIDDKYDCSKDAFDQAFTRFDDKRSGFLQKSQNYQFVKYVLPEDVKQSDQIMDNPQGEDGHDDNSDAESSTSSVSLKSISQAEEDVPESNDRQAN